MINILLVVEFNKYKACIADTDADSCAGVDNDTFYLKCHVH